MSFYKNGVKNTQRFLIKMAFQNNAASQFNFASKRKYFHDSVAGDLSTLHKICIALAVLGTCIAMAVEYSKSNDDEDDKPSSWERPVSIIALSISLFALSVNEKLGLSTAADGHHEISAKYQKVCQKLQGTECRSDFVEIGRKLNKYAESEPVVSGILAKRGNKNARHAPTFNGGDAPRIVQIEAIAARFAANLVKKTKGNAFDDSGFNDQDSFISL